MSVRMGVIWALEGQGGSGGETGKGLIFTRVPLKLFLYCGLYVNEKTGDGNNLS